MVIIKPFLPEDARINLLKWIQDHIQKNNGKIIEEDIWGKRHLAYKIKGNEEAYYIVYDIEISPKDVKGLEKGLKMNQEILRFLVLKK